MVERSVLVYPNGKSGCILSEHLAVAPRMIHKVPEEVQKSMAAALGLIESLFTWQTSACPGERTR